MSPEKMVKLYEELMYSGRQTAEKHIRYLAEQVVKDHGGGFSRAESTSITVPWQAEPGRGYVDVVIVVPAGMHGFALQMVIEAQIKEQIL